MEIDYNESRLLYWVKEQKRVQAINLDSYSEPISPWVHVGHFSGIV